MEHMETFTRAYYLLSASYDMLLAILISARLLSMKSGFDAGCAARPPLTLALTRQAQH
jgi:hypothetical protein